MLKGFLFIKVCILGLLLAGLPLFGIILTGNPLKLNTLISLDTILLSSVESLPIQPFSLLITMLLASLMMLVFTLFLIPVLYYIKHQRLKVSHTKKLPWWGWFALGCLAIFWFLLWGHFPSVRQLQPYTFTALWCSYIVLLNALTYRRTERCMLRNRLGYLSCLFLASIPFWWYFEYLNRFVLNWYYLVGDSTTPSDYILFGSFGFATVLPAVISTRDFLLSFPCFTAGFDSGYSIEITKPRFAAGIFLVVGSIGLTSIGIWPQYLFPLLWIAPLMVLLSLQTIWGDDHILYPLASGRWSTIVTAAMAALICGFFWEMWNFYSLPKWVYSVPWVYHLKIFEMPLLGYLGYLPFGLECVAIAELIKKLRISV